MNHASRAVLVLACALAGQLLMARGSAAWLYAGVAATLLVALSIPIRSALLWRIALAAPLLLLCALAIDAAFAAQSTVAGPVSPKRALAFLACIPAALVFATFRANDRTWRRWPARAALLVLAVILSANVLELVVRRFLPVDPYYVRPLPGSKGDDPLTRWVDLPADHPGRRYKWIHTPGFKGTFPYAEFGNAPFDVNAQGFRGRDWPEAGAPEGELRVFVLGDSLTAGTGVGNDETFAHVLEQRLRERAPELDARVFNGGVSGYGPGECLFVLEDWGDRVAPHVVVATFYDGNDLEDLYWQFDFTRRLGLHQAVLPSAMMKAEEKGRFPSLHLEPAGLFDAEYWRGTLTWTFFGERVSQVLLRHGWIEPRAVFNGVYLRSMYIGAPDVEIEEEIGLALLAFERMRAFCDARAIRFVVARLPGKIQTREQDFQRMLDDLGLARKDFDRTLPGREVLARLEAAGIATVDLLPVLERAPGEPLLFFDEGHPNVEGHRRIAATLADALLPPPAER